nr:reverse transcriptase domain-containing protein [Tanacetum cinerariifolium]
HDKIPKSVYEMMRVTTSFLKGVVAASSRERKKSFSSWKQQEDGQKQNFKKGGFRNQQRSERKQDSKATGKTKQRQQKRGNIRKEQTASNPDGEEDGMEGPMIIEAEMGGHFLHRMYVNGGSSSEIMKVGSKEIPGSSVYSSRNAKIPSNMWNSHITEQQDYSTRVHNGLRTKNAASQEGRKEMCGLQRHNLDIFAWKPADMTRVPHHIAEHKLNICEGRLPVRQKKRRQAHERNKEIYKEVEKLVNAGIMKEVHYHSWLSNPVMLKKHDDGWRMCVDFKDLNKACPKDGYPLSEIDWKVESLCGNAQRKVTSNGLQKRNSIQANEKINSGVAYVNRTKREKGINSLLGGCKGSHQCSPNNGKGRETSAHLLCQACITRSENQLHSNGEADTCFDALSKMASTSFTHLSKQVLIEELKEKSIDEKEVLAVVEEERRTWMTLSHEYLTEEILPEEKRKARATHHKAGPGKVKILIVAIDYFTKWIEAKPVAAIIGAQIKKFVWDNMVCRKGKQGLRGRNQGAVGRKKQKLDGIDFTCLMGTPYYDQIKQRRNTILTCVWNESDDFSRNRHANLENCES